MQGEITTPSEANALPSQESGLSASFVPFSFALMIVGAILFFLFGSPLFMLLGIPLLICGLSRPKDLLIAAIALSPLTVSLTGETYAGKEGPSAMFGLSDVLLLLAIPGLIRYGLRHKAQVSLGKMTLPLLLYLAAGLLSYVMNLHLMHGLARSYFMGYLRTAQMIVVIPLFFAMVDWDEDDLRRLLRGFLACSLFLAVLGIIAFAAGKRDGLYMGGQKNAIALTLAIGIMIALAALLPQKNQPTSAKRVFDLTGLERWYLILAVVLCGLTLVLELSRSAALALIVGLLYLCAQRRKPLVFVGILVALGLTGLIVHRMLPPDAELNLTNLRTDRYSQKQRFTTIHESLQRFRENKLLGDGFRSRRDYLPHNLEVTLLAEGGLLGLALFCFVLWMQMRLLYQATHTFRSDPVREWVCMTIFISSLAILVQAQFDPYWRRGPLVLTWAGMGIVLSMLRRISEAKGASDALPPSVAQHGN